MTPFPKVPLLGAGREAPGEEILSNSATKWHAEGDGGVARAAVTPVQHGETEAQCEEGTPAPRGGDSPNVPLVLLDVATKRD